MRRPRFSFCPNPQDGEHMTAWETLQTVPEGQRSGFVARAILRMQEETVLEETLRRVLREELQTLSLQPSSPLTEVGQHPVSGPDPAPAPTIPQEMLGFLHDLMESK